MILYVNGQLSWTGDDLCREPGVIAQARMDRAPTRFGITRRRWVGPSLFGFDEQAVFYYDSPKEKSTIEQFQEATNIINSIGQGVCRVTAGILGCERNLAEVALDNFVRVTVGGNV